MLVLRSLLGLARHRLVPCVVEEGGRLGGHFQALLRELAERGVSRMASFGFRPRGVLPPLRWLLIPTGSENGVLVYLPGCTRRFPVGFYVPLTQVYLTQVGSDSRL